jgi:hypothetical protein
MVADNETALPLPPCGHCGGVDCGVPRVVLCCTSCTHT